MVQRLLYLSTRETSNFLYDGNLLHPESITDYNTALLNQENTPITVLLDMMDEEFVQDTIPRVSGRDRQLVLTRKCQSRYRNTPYSYAKVQEKLPKGENGFKILMTSQPNPDQISTWIKQIHDREALLTGISSLPLLSEQVIRTLAPKAEYTMLITHQKSSGIRQSLFHNQHLKFSRLTQPPEHINSPEHYAAFIQDEVQKTKNYLSSLHVLPRRETYTAVYVLSHGDYHQALTALPPTEQLVFHPQLINDVATRCKINYHSDSYFCDDFFSLLVLNHPSENHYASAKERLFFLRYKNNKHLRTMAVSLALLACFFGAKTFIDATLMTQKNTYLEQKVGQLKRLIQQEKRGIPQLNTSAANIQKIAQHGKTLAILQKMPDVFLARLSQALNEHPSLLLNQLDWRTEKVQAPKKTKKKRRRRRRRAPPPPIIIQAEHAIVDGEIKDFRGDYDAALNTLESFRLALQTYPEVSTVTLDKTPQNLTATMPISVQEMPNSQENSSALPEVARYQLVINFEPSR
jgi:hypothetical protein